MTKRTVAKLAAGVLLASSGMVAGLASPSAAADSGWNGTRIGTTADSGWNGTKVTKDAKFKKDGKVKRAVVKKDSDSGWNGTRVGTTSDSGWNGT